jgi:hypothetical protein
MIIAPAARNSFEFANASFKPSPDYSLGNSEENTIGILRLAELASE